MNYRRIQNIPLKQAYQTSRTYGQQNKIGKMLHKQNEKFYKDIETIKKTEIPELKVQ